jgi:hypothetical protein
MSATNRTLVAVGLQYTKCPVYPVGELGSAMMCGPGVRSISSSALADSVDMLAVIATASITAAMGLNSLAVRPPAVGAC